MVFCIPSFAGNVTMFGPKTYLRTTGNPNIYDDSFTAVNGTAQITIRNGTIDGRNRIVDAISSAWIYINGVEIFRPNDFNRHIYLLEATVNLAEMNGLHVVLSSNPGSYISIEIDQYIPEPTLSVAVQPATIYVGQNATLSWSTGNADTVAIDQQIGSVAVNGTMSVSPTVDMTYTVTASNLGGEVSQTVVVTVLPLPTVNLTVSPNEILEGTSATLSWISADADTCTIDPDVGTVPISGSVSVSPDTTTTYTITATNPGGTATDSIMVTVVPLPTATFSILPETIYTGQSAVLSWSTQNADDIRIEPGIEAVASSGTVNVAPAESTTYTITATNHLGGAFIETVDVIVLPLPTVDLTVSPNEILEGTSATLSWISADADTCTINPDVGTVPISGSISVSPDTTTTYTITATNPGGTATDSIMVTVVPLPTATFSILPETIYTGSLRFFHGPHRMQMIFVLSRA